MYISGVFTSSLKEKDMSLFKSGTIAGKVVTWVRAEIIKANAFVNNVKTIEQSPTVQTLEDVLFPLLESVFPAAHIPGIALVVVKWFKALNTVTNGAAAEVAKTDAEIAKDGINYLLKLKIIDATAYAVLMNGFNAYVTVGSSAINGNPVAVEVALASVQPVYASEKAANEVVQDNTDVVASVANVTDKVQDIPGHPGFSAGVDKDNEPVNSFTPAPTPNVATTDL